MTFENEADNKLHWTFDFAFKYAYKIFLLSFSKLLLISHYNRNQCTLYNIVDEAVTYIIYGQVYKDFNI